MKIRLGYVAISRTLNPITSSHTISFKNYEKLGIKGNEKIDSVILNNLKSLEEILKYNLKNDIYFYRMTSNLIPLATHKCVKYEWINKYESYFKKIGSFIVQNNMRVDLHPDQFCVINSDKKDVVKSSINILKYHQNMLKKFNLSSKLVLHIGSSLPNKKEALKRFEDVFNSLEDDLKKIIILENDDKTFTMKDTLELCEKLNIPMVLDYHHHCCLNNSELIKDYIERIFNTWNNQNLNPKIHFSSPKNKKEYRTHNEYINVDDFLNFLDEIKFVNRDFDVMLESKGKDEALFRLIRQIKYKTEYFFINNTTFLI